MITDLWFYAIAIPAILITGISKGGFGGLGTLAVPLMTLAIAPRQAAAIMLPILCLMDIIAMTAYWKKWDGPNMKILLMSAPIGIAVGWATFRYLDAGAIRLLIGLLAMTFALRYWINFKANKTKAALGPDPVKGSFWGAISGFTSFVSHTGSPPVSVYLLPQKLHKTAYQGTAAVYFATVNYLKLIPYYFLGQFSSENLGTSAVLLPLAIAGVFLGIWLHKRVSERIFYPIVHAALLGIGIKLVYDGVLAVF